MSKVLTAKVKINAKSATSSLSKLEKKIKRLDSALNKVGKSNTLTKRITSSITKVDKLAKSINKSKTTTDKLAASANKVNKNFQKSGSAVSGLTTKLKGLAAAYLGVMGVKGVISTADIITSAENRLNALNGNDHGATQANMDKMYSAAMRSRLNYGDVIGNVSKSMTLAGDSFGNNIDNAIRFQEIMGKSYTLGGASAAEMSSSMYQMIQALGSGILQGDELRSVREGAPLAYKAIEKFAQGVLNSDESLKELASQGKITSDIVVAAVLDMGENVDKAFEDTSMTFAQAGTKIKNMAIKSFEPVLQKLNDILNSKAGQAIIESFGKLFTFVAKVLYGVLLLIEKGINWAADNWYWLADVVEAVAVVIAGAIAYMMGPVGWVIGGILLIIYIFTKLGYEAQEIVGAIGGGFLFLTYLIWDIVSWVVAIIVAAVSIIWDVILTIGAFTVTLLIAIAGIVVLSTMMVIQIIMWALTTLWASIVTIYNVFYTIVMGAWGLIQKAVLGVYDEFAWLAKGVLNILYTIANAIDSVFGSNLADTVNGWIKGIDSLGDTLQKKLDPESTFKKIGTQWSVSYQDLGDRYAGKGKYDSWNITDDIGNLGNEVGDALDTIRNVWADKALNPIEPIQWAIGATLNPMEGWNTGKEFGSTLTTEVLEAFDAIANGDLNITPTDMESLLNGVGDTADNTGRIADTMELTEEDLDYLRKIAEMEWKKEFTTAKVTVDMSNYNTIQDGTDLDGLVTKLTEKLYEELGAVANGVYV